MKHIKQKKEKKKFELGCCQRFISFFFCCCDWTFYHGNYIIHSPDDFIEEKLDVMYYIKNMLLLEVINKLEFEHQQNFINFLITPIIESKSKYKGDDKSKIKGEDDSDDDIYKEVSHLEYNEVSEEIMNSMKSKQIKDIKLINMLEEKINNYVNNYES